MATSRKSRSVYDEEKILAQFTSGQLVVALSVAIFVCCVCYMLGMLTERYYAARQEGPVAALPAIASDELPLPVTATAPAAPASGPTPPAAPASPSEDLLSRARTQAAPRETRLPDPADSRSMPPLPARGTVDRPPRSTTVAIPAPSTPRSPSESATSEKPESPEPVAPAKTETPEPAATPASKTETDTELARAAAPPIEPKKPSPPATPQRETASPQPPPLQPSDPPEESMELGWGAFGVQLAAFNGDKAKAQADDYKQSVKKKLNIDSEVLQYEDGYYRVLKVGFKDRATASKAAEALRKQEEFKDCFVQPLP